MHVIVAGCGRVGSGLAAALDAQGHEVAVVDRSTEAFSRLPQGFAGTLHHGVGFDRDVLVAAGIEGADAVVAVTSGDNSNVVIARTAREAYEVEHVVARIYDPARARIYERLGIPTVATARWTIDQVLRHVGPEIGAPDWTDPTGSVSLVAVPLPSRLAGTDAATADPGPHGQIVAVTREGRARRCGVELVLQEGDLVHLLVDDGHLADVAERFAARAPGER
jgi:trk system potassium uptake protein TrkA